MKSFTVRGIEFNLNDSGRYTGDVNSHPYVVIHHDEFLGMKDVWQATGTGHIGGCAHTPQEAVERVFEMFEKQMNYWKALLP